LISAGGSIDLRLFTTLPQFTLSKLKALAVFCPAAARIVWPPRNPNWWGELSSLLPGIHERI
jgi:hypothetical protein